MSALPAELSGEIERLAARGLSAGCLARPMRDVAALTLSINRLKERKKAVICAHVYQTPDIICGVGDLVGDSYKLAEEARGTKAENVIFCGVHFMAETAKILDPSRRVFVPSGNAGCSLSESITAADVRELKARHPGLPVVTYINTSAGVKAESDCVVTSANAEKILVKMYREHERLIFIPDRFMGANLARKLGKTPGKDIILWNGSCVVHEKFDPRLIETYRRRYPGLVALAHAECPSEIINAVDFMGGTGDMLSYVRDTGASAYLLVTECGFGELARLRFPEKNFIAMCRLCPYMKSITLDSVLDALERLPAELEVTVPPDTAARARVAIEKMFELAR
ncbi:MAG TPA: quinolinate synthase NadA [Elusimicrobiales bacterium]|nr:quinolinate synthase NadA [Elusimicrobiales bacterium]